MKKNKLSGNYLLLLIAALLVQFAVVALAEAKPKPGWIIDEAKEVNPAAARAYFKQKKTKLTKANLTKKNI